MYYTVELDYRPIDDRSADPSTGQTEECRFCIRSVAIYEWNITWAVWHGIEYAALHAGCSSALIVSTCRRPPEEPVRTDRRTFARPESGHTGNLPGVSTERWPGTALICSIAGPSRWLQCGCTYAVRHYCIKCHFWSVANSSSCTAATDVATRGLWYFQGDQQQMLNNIRHW